jgi:hypothetical protein
MHRVACNGGDHSLENIDRELLSCTLAHVFGLEHGIDVSGLVATKPDELASHLPDAEQRKQAFHMVSYMPFLVPGDLDDFSDLVSRRADLVLQYADALQVEGHEVKYTQKLRDKKIRLLRLDFARWILNDLVPGKGVRGKVKGLIKAMKETRGNPKVAAPYQKLGLLPEGTLGRSIWEFYRRREFPFPGEPGCLPEDLVMVHDLSHVLSDNNTDPRGEVAAVAFQAGYMRRHSYEMMMDVFFAFQFNFILEYGAPQMLATYNQIDPHLAMESLRLGMECNFDFMDGWNYWEDMEQTVESLRDRYNIQTTSNDNLMPPEHLRGTDTPHRETCPPIVG